MSVSDMTQQLVRRGALDRLADRERTRLILGAVRSGVPQREISRCLANVSQTTVNRILARAEVDPDLDRTTPAEVIDRHAAGEIGEQQMMETLMNWQYTFGGVRAVDGVDTDAYTSGDWDQVERAFYRGLLSDNQFETLMNRQNELTDRTIAASVGRRDRQQTHAIRQWAVDSGYEVSDRGRIPSSIEQAYAAAVLRSTR